MHEWALAEGVIATALKAAEKEGMSEITKIVVSIGALQQIETETFKEALKYVLPPSEPRLKSVDILLRIEPATCRCRVCGHMFTFAEAIKDLDEAESEAIHFIPELAHTCLSCAACRSPDFEIIKGRGIWIDHIEGTA